MVGVSKDKSKIYIVCIDGRKNGIGATHAEAAKIMKDTVLMMLFTLTVVALQQWLYRKRVQLLLQL